MYKINLPSISAPAYPEQCSQCSSKQNVYSGGPREIEVRFACGSSWKTLWDNEAVQWITTESFYCKEGDVPVCANCGGVKCMHFVCRDWEFVDKCDGWCCPDCRPVDSDTPLPENWHDKL